LPAIDRTEVAVLVGPVVPDRDAVLIEIFDVGVAAQKPQQFVDDGFDMQLLVVTSGKPRCKSKRIWWPKIDSVPMPVRSRFSTPR